jgi:hypothetical protein
MLSAIPSWQKEPDIRTFGVEKYTLDYIINGTHTTKAGYLLKMYRNDKIRQIHFFTNKRRADKHGNRYMKEDKFI